MDTGRCHKIESSAGWKRAILETRITITTIYPEPQEANQSIHQYSPLETEIYAMPLFGIVPGGAGLPRGLLSRG